MTRSPAPPPGTEDTTIWVQSDAVPDGTYRVGFSIGLDRAWRLSVGQAVRYAVACFDSATAAEHDAAVLGLLRNRLGLPLEQAGRTLQDDIRRPRRRSWPTASALTFVPGVTAAGKPS